MCWTDSHTLLLRMENGESTVCMFLKLKRTFTMGPSSATHKHLPKRKGHVSTQTLGACSAHSSLCLKKIQMSTNWRVDTLFVTSMWWTTTATLINVPCAQRKKPDPKATCYVVVSWCHLSEICGKGKSIETENGMIVVRVGNRTECKGTDISLRLGWRNVLELHCDNSTTCNLLKFI